MNPTHQPSADVTVTPADILRCAAKYLQLHGWHQGDLFTNAELPTPAACAIGAIRMAVCGGPDTAYTHAQATEMTAALRAFAGLLVDWSDPDEIGTDDPHQVIADWNDDAHRRADQVTAALVDAADRWDQFHTKGGGDRS